MLIAREKQIDKRDVFMRVRRSHGWFGTLDAANLTAEPAINLNDS